MLKGMLCFQEIKVCQFQNIKKKNIIGRVKATVKKYLAHVICKTGRSALKYLANPSIIGSITHAKRLKIIAFMNLKDID